jgi:adenine-specific DNA-methyltransferase
VNAHSHCSGKSSQRTVGAVTTQAIPFVPITRPGGLKLSLPQRLGSLIALTLKEMCPRFTPGGELIYATGLANRISRPEKDCLKSIMLSIEQQERMPNVLVYHRIQNWLVMIDVAEGNGPISVKRRHELKTLFGGSNAGLVFASAFLNRESMAHHLEDIAWHTVVWCADSPDHLIQFNGRRVLGPSGAIR